MKLTNIGGFDTIDHYAAHKIAAFGEREKNFETLFEFMFSETDNVMAEITDGYRIKKTTYGEFRSEILAIVPTLSSLLIDVSPGSLVGLYLGNSMNWLRIFWAIVISGYRPLLMNMSLPTGVLEEILTEHSVGAVISDGTRFSVKTVTIDEAVTPSDASLPDRPYGTEVLFMSSGTTERVKLCAYTAENFYYQICDSVNIIHRCPQMKRHYKGELKQLVLLPFYHVFGFIAVYLWFGFFSRTFVFLKNLAPSTIQNTVKKHEVTHIFAVPMVWERVYRAVRKQVRSRGDRTFGKFKRAVKLSNALGPFGKRFARIALKEIRRGLFGDSICFLISGGGALDTEVFEFYNGIGYHLANGYGMTEIGITSVEKSSKQSVLCTASVGAPFGYTEYRRDNTGELLVKGKTRAARITQGSDTRVTDYDEWFHTGDLVSVRKGRYYHEGRMDDVVIGAGGENLNPTLLEPRLSVAGCDAVCLISGEHREPVLIASVRGCFAETQLENVFEALDRALGEAKLDRVVSRVFVTPDALMEPSEIKISRHKVRKKYLSGALRCIERDRVREHIDTVVSELQAEIITLFAEALEKEPSEIAVDSHFFRELGGTSLSYFVLLELIKNKYAIEIADSAKENLFTPRDFFEHIKTAK